MSEAPLYIDLDGNVHRGPVMDLRVREEWLTDSQLDVVRRFQRGEDIKGKDRETLMRAVKRLVHPEAWYGGRGRGTTRQAKERKSNG